MFYVIDSVADSVVVNTISAQGILIDGPRQFTWPEFIAEVASRERDHAQPRWVWNDTSFWYSRLLNAGARVQRCVDLRLSHAILRNSELTADSVFAKAAHSAWDDPPLEESRSSSRQAESLFELDYSVEIAPTDSVAEFVLQREAIAAAKDPNRIGLLLAAESAGALIAAEMRFTGLPWRADLHEGLLESLLGPRPKQLERPRKLQILLEQIRFRLSAPELNPDSPAELIRALNRAGITVTSTRTWELEKLSHPVIDPLLEYKKLSRLFGANGWHWLDVNVKNGRFRPDYVVGGVVTGRWASKGGGGALQLPKQVRGAVVADPGWKLVVADASQLEPRILAALSGDSAMAKAGQARDMYSAIVASGAVATREKAKIAMLGAMYGATTGESGRLLPALTRAYPRAIGFVEGAARAGERGDVVTTRLGRSSPRPGGSWNEVQAAAYRDASTDADAKRARSQARSWGRFTRNFVVQGSAAEWALCWMATLRTSLRDIADGAWITKSPHLVFFLHDEIVVHSPAPVTDAVVAAIEHAATEAGRLLFGKTPVEFPLTIAVVDSYADAK